MDSGSLRRTPGSLRSLLRGPGRRKEWKASITIWPIQRTRERYALRAWAVLSLCLGLVEERFQGPEDGPGNGSPNPWIKQPFFLQRRTEIEALH